MPGKAFLAWDLGAESGRAMVGVLDSGRLALHELYRFAHAPAKFPTGYYWDLPGLWRHVLDGTRKAVAWCKELRVELVSVGVDTWGVDFGLLDQHGELLGLPLAYRDPRHEAGMRRVLEQVGAQRLYRTTGLQTLPFNTLFQLVAMRERGSKLLEQATSLLMMPDLFHYFLCGRRANEYTIASTSQMLDPNTRQWAMPLLSELEIPTGMLGEIVPPGTALGPLAAAVREETGAGDGLVVVAPASHDTASAVAAVPADPRTRWAYLSSGTWSLLGAELEQPVLTEAAARVAFTNEGGLGNRIRFLKNIAGLWLVQECRRHYARLGCDYDYDQLARTAADAPPLRTLINPDDPAFLLPGDMPEKIADFAAKTSQPVPQSPGEMVRCCLESLALTYRLRLQQLERLLPSTFEVLHVVGGGGRNPLLNQMTADACGCTVLVGPHEATAVGNILAQAQYGGEVRNLADIRRVVAASTDVETYTPRKNREWEDAYGRFLAVSGASVS